MTTQNAIGHGYPKVGRGRGSPFGLPLAPQVAQVVALSPEAAPGLVSAAAGYPLKPGRNSTPNLQQREAPAPLPQAKNATPDEQEASKPSSASSQKSGRPPRPSKSDAALDGAERPPGISASPTPNRAVATGPARRPMRGTGVMTTAATPPRAPKGSDADRPPHRISSRDKRRSSENGSLASRTSSRERRRTSNSPAPRTASDARRTAGEAKALTESVVLFDADEGNALSDVTQLLYRHKGLESLHLPGTVDFGELINLRVLSLSHNQLTDIRPVAELPLLVDLNVNNNQIKDLSPAFQCEELEVLFAANNRVSSVSGLELQSLRHLSLFRNDLSDLPAVLDVLSTLPGLRRLDIGGNSCVDDDSQSYGIVRTLPQLERLDGEPVGQVDRALAEEFFACARDMGFNERPCTAGPRPKTAPAPRDSLRKRRQRRPSASPSRSPSVQHRSGRSQSPFVAGSSARHLPELPGEDVASPGGAVLAAVRQKTSQIEAVRLQIQTVQVDCENLRRQIVALRDREPTLGLAGLRERRKELEEENRLMHDRVSENRRLREALAQKEAELSAKRLAKGLPEEPPERPRSARPRSSCGSASAAVAADAILELSERLQNEADGLPIPSFRSSSRRQEDTEADLRFRNHLLRKEIERTKERIQQSRTDAFSTLLGKELVIAPSDEAAERLSRRPRTAAPRLGQESASGSSGQRSEIDDLLQRNEQNLLQFTGRLRETERALGMQRPMTTGHLQSRKVETGSASAATLD